MYKKKKIKEGNKKRKTCSLDMSGSFLTSPCTWELWNSTVYMRIPSTQKLSWQVRGHLQHLLCMHCALGMAPRQRPTSSLCP